jgi:hypothetical protein
MVIKINQLFLSISQFINFFKNNLKQNGDEYIGDFVSGVMSGMGRLVKYVYE